MCSLKELESHSDDHLRASGPWLVRAADPLRSTPAPSNHLAHPSATSFLVELTKHTGDCTVVHYDIGATLWLLLLVTAPRFSRADHSRAQSAH